MSVATSQVLKRIWAAVVAPLTVLSLIVFIALLVGWVFPPWSGVVLNLTWRLTHPSVVSLGTLIALTIADAVLLVLVVVLDVAWCSGSPNSSGPEDCAGGNRQERGD